MPSYFHLDLDKFGGNAVSARRDSPRSEPGRGQQRACGKRLIEKPAACGLIKPGADEVNSDHCSLTGETE